MFTSTMHTVKETKHGAQVKDPDQQRAAVWRHSNVCTCMDKHMRNLRVSNRPSRSERNMHSVKQTTDWTNDFHHTFF